MSCTTAEPEHVSYPGESMLASRCQHVLPAPSSPCLPPARPACPQHSLPVPSTPCLSCGRVSSSSQDLALPQHPLAPRSACHPVLVPALLAGTVHQHPSPYYPCPAQGSAPRPPTRQQVALTAQRWQQQQREKRKKKLSPGENKVPLPCTAPASSAPASPWLRGSP